MRPCYIPHVSVQILPYEPWKEVCCHVLCHIFEQHGPRVGSIDARPSRAPPRAQSQCSVLAHGAKCNCVQICRVQNLGLSYVTDAWMAGVEGNIGLHCGNKHPLHQGATYLLPLAAGRMRLPYSTAHLQWNAIADQTHSTAQNQTMPSAEDSLTHSEGSETNISSSQV